MVNLLSNRKEISSMLCVSSSARNNRDYFIPMFRTISYSFMNYILSKPDDKAFNGAANYIQAMNDSVF